MIALIYLQNTYINVAIRGRGHVGGAREIGIGHLADDLGRVLRHLHGENGASTDPIKQVALGRRTCHRI